MELCWSNNEWIVSEGLTLAECFIKSQNVLISSKFSLESICFTSQISSTEYMLVTIEPLQNTHNSVSILIRIDCYPYTDVWILLRGEARYPYRCRTLPNIYSNLTAAIRFNFLLSNVYPFRGCFWTFDSLQPDWLQPSTSFRSCDSTFTRCSRLRLYQGLAGQIRDYYSSLCCGHLVIHRRTD